MPPILSLQCSPLTTIRAQNKQTHVAYQNPLAPSLLLLLQTPVGSNSEMEHNLDFLWKIPYKL